MAALPLSGRRALAGYTRTIYNGIAPTFNGTAVFYIAKSFYYLRDS